MAIKYLDAKRIRGSSTGTATLTYSNDFSSDNMVDVDSSKIGISGGVLNFDSERDGTNDASSWDLGSTLSDTAWVMRFKTILTTISASGGQNTIFMFFGMSSLPSSSGSSASHDFIGTQIKKNSGSSVWKAQSINGSNLDVEGTDFGHTATTETVYVEVKRTSATTGTVELFSDATYETSVESENISGITSAITGLRYFWAGNLDGSGGSTNAIVGTIDDVKIYNGVTEVEVDEKATLVVAPIAGITDEKFVNPDANTALQWEWGVAAYKVEGNKILAGHTLIGKTISEISGYYFRQNGTDFSGDTCSAHLFNSNGTKKGSFGTVNVTDMYQQANQGLHDTAEIESHGGLVSGSAVVAEGDIIGFMNDWTLGAYEWVSMGKKESDSALTDTHYQQLATFTWTGSALTPTLTDDKSIQCQVKTAVVAGTSNLPANTLFEETDTYRTYWLQDNEWKGYILRGCFGGGNTGSLSNVIDYITIASAGNAADFGDIVSARRNLAAVADATRGCFAGGYTTGNQNIIEYITVETTSNTTDFGDLDESRRSLTGVADATRGCFGGGWGSSASDKIDYITIQTTGNAADFGNLTHANQARAGFANATRGVWSGGDIGGSPGSVNTIDYITIQTTGNATDFGDLTVIRAASAGVADKTRGVTCGGNNGTADQNIMDYVTIDTTGNATDFGDLTTQFYNSGGCSDLSRGCIGGGRSTSTTYMDSIDYITIATTGNGTDFGNLTVARQGLAGLAA